MGKPIQSDHLENGHLSIPEGYSPVLNIRDTEKAIKSIKLCFQDKLGNALNLQRVSAPIVVSARSGINDYLNGVEQPVSFQIKDMDGERGEVVQSLAKWKRKALADYDFESGEGLYTDMNALRPDEVLDNMHSIYVDQWDWERVMSADERNLTFLKDIVSRIYQAIREIEQTVCKEYPVLPEPILPEDITFIHTEELEEMYPDLTPRERESMIAKEKGAVFVIGIGANLKSGEPHDGRASDYDDWTTPNEKGFLGLNGDIVIWYPILNRGFELSSMGIRVDKTALMRQLEIRDELFKVDQDFHQRLLSDRLPQTIGGGIGQSRLCMMLLRKAHVGEVQAAIWPEQMIETCKDNHIPLL
ncbi:aspartate--ammonia ligase [candidate division KSB1 bacterium]|nr:aspartate--ammonia ligase [candidate division KSB1 bacterium]